MNQNCDHVQQLVGQNLMSDGRINGRWRATFYAKVREWVDTKGNLRQNTELRIINLEKLA